MSDNQKTPLAIVELITRRCEELGLRPSHLVNRCGYKNVSRGLRRLQKLHEGDLKGASGLIPGLPTALELSPDVVKHAVEESKRQVWEAEKAAKEAEEAAWRAAFKPHAIILTEQRSPEPIFVAAFIGVDRLLRVDFDLTKKPVSFTDQALQGVREKLARWKSQSLPAFGRPTGVIVNYSPDRAVQFDLEGKPHQVFDRAYQPGKASLSIKGRPLTESELAAVFGTR
jgi:hypothetical protein